MSRFTIKSFSGSPLAFRITLATDSVFQNSSCSRLTGLRSGLFDSLAVFRMNLFERGGVLQFRRRVPQDLLIGKTVEDSMAFHIYDGNHVRRILADQMKKFFSFEQLPANPVNLQMLINRVQIEQENKTNQTSYSLGQYIRRMKIWVR